MYKLLDYLLILIVVIISNNVKNIKCVVLLEKNSNECS